MPGPKGQESLAQALAWVFRFIARGPEGAPAKETPRNQMSKRILRHRQADRSSNHGRYGIHPTHQPVNSSTRHHAPRFGCPFRARRDKTAFPRVNPGLSFPGPLGRKTDAKQIVPLTEYQPKTSVKTVSGSKPSWSPRLFACWETKPDPEVCAFYVFVPLTKKATKLLLEDGITSFGSYA